MANTSAHVFVCAASHWEIFSAESSRRPPKEDEAPPQHPDNIQEFDDESDLLRSFKIEPEPVFEEDFFRIRDTYCVNGVPKLTKEAHVIPMCHELSTHKDETHYPIFKLPSTLVWSVGLSHSHTITVTSEIVHSKGEHDTFYLEPVTSKLYVSPWSKTPTLGVETMTGVKVWPEPLHLWSVLSEISDARDRTCHRQWVEEICSNFFDRLGEARIARVSALSSCHFPLRDNVL